MAKAKAKEETFRIELNLRSSTGDWLDGGGDLFENSRDATVHNIKQQIIGKHILAGWGAAMQELGDLAIAASSGD